MNCQRKESAEILIDYCAKTLAPDRAAEFEKHLETCPDCRRQVEEQSALWRTLDAWTPPPVAADFDARLFARIGKEESASFWTRWSWKPAVSLLAVCAVVVVALLVRVPRHDDKVDIEQVEQTLDDLDVLAP